MDSVQPIGHQLAVLRSLAPPAAQPRLRQLVHLSEAVRVMVNAAPTSTSRMHHFPELAVNYMARVLASFPNQVSADALLRRYFPYHLFGLESPYSNRLGMVLEQLGMPTVTGTGYNLEAVIPAGSDSAGTLQFVPAPVLASAAEAGAAEGGDSADTKFGNVLGADAANVEVQAAVGGWSVGSTPEGVVMTPEHEQVLAELAQDHYAGKDL